jgi:hypothetical protein
MATLAQTTIGPAGTFYNETTGYLPYARQWGSIYLLICNRNTTNDYWAWDGTLFTVRARQHHKVLTSYLQVFLILAHRQLLLTAVVEAV